MAALFRAIMLRMDRNEIDNEGFNEIAERNRTAILNEGDKMLFSMKMLRNEKLKYDAAGDGVTVGRFMATHLPNRMNSIAVARAMIREVEASGSSNRVWLRGNDKLKVTLELVTV